MAKKRVKNVDELVKREVKRKIIHPHPSPRYLPGSVAGYVIKGDMQQFTRHRFNVLNAVPKIDDSAPHLSADQLLKSAKIADDIKRIKKLIIDNNTLVEKINKINRLGGIVDSYNPNAYKRNSNWTKHDKWCKNVVHQNLKFYKKLVHVESRYSRQELEKHWQHNLQQMKAFAKYDLCVLKVQTLDQKMEDAVSISGGPRLSEGQKRPRVFLEFEIENGHFNLGKIVIELYIDYCPNTAQNFYSLCTGDDGLCYKGCRFYKIIPGQYCHTGDIVNDNGTGGKSIFGDKFPEENYELKHTRAGVVSMITYGKKMNNSQFLITFNEYPLFDGKRVAFGKVVKGYKTLFEIQDLGQNSGRPKEKIVIVNCGEFKGTAKKSLKTKSH